MADGNGSDRALPPPAALTGRHVVSPDSLKLACRRPEGRQRVVLLAEDDAKVREAIRLLIELQGCTVIEAGDGSQAVAFASAFAGTIDLLVADAVMPGMTGPAVYDLVRRQRPSLPAIFVSAHPLEIVFPGGNLPPSTTFLHKPFAPRDFANAFEQLVPHHEGPRRVA